MDTLTSALVLGLDLFFLVELTRALPWPAVWRQRKPLNCSICLTGWNGIAAGVSLYWWRAMQPFDAIVLMAAASGVALFLTHKADTWRGPHHLP